MDFIQTEKAQPKKTAPLNFTPDYFDVFFAALILAHLAFWAAIIRAFPAALILRFAGLAVALAEVELPSNAFSSFSSFAILSLMFAALVNCAEVNDDKVLISTRE